MSRFNLPETTADRIAATLTLATVVALAWLIAATPQDSRAAAFAAAAAASAQRIHERSDVAAPVVVDCYGRQKFIVGLERVTAGLD
jgi:hypothetical protein